MKRMTRFFLAVLLVTLSPALAWSQTKAKGKDEFDMIGLCRQLKGRIVDHTGNHGQDNRIWSKALHQWRDLYIYLPPGYTRNERYPIMIFLHPFALDERTFLRLAPVLDEAIACGKLPPMIVAAPDGVARRHGLPRKAGELFPQLPRGAL